MDEHSILRMVLHDIEGEIDKTKEGMSRGNCKDMSEYQHLVGKIEALRHVVGFIEHRKASS